MRALVVSSNACLDGYQLPTASAPELLRRLRVHLALWGQDSFVHVGESGYIWTPGFLEMYLMVGASADHQQYEVSALSRNASFNRTDHPGQGVIGYRNIHSERQATS
jgi:hypothetical protein